MIENYRGFIQRKSFPDVASGFKDVKDSDLNDSLFDFQKLLVSWSLKKGRSAIFADTGLGKTRMQLSWADAVQRRQSGKTLILAPLAVSSQTVAEAAKMGIDVSYTRKHPDKSGIYITNYDISDRFDLTDLSAIVLDESSIIKHQTSKFRNWLIGHCKAIPYRLSCTATPSPNDYMELGNQAEFIGIMGMFEMLAMFFTHDSGETSKWRLKGHGKDKFWEWLATWAAVVRKPSDLGFLDDGYNLPPLLIHEHIVETNKQLGDSLFKEPAATLSERNQARRLTIEDRVAKCSEIVNATDDPYLVWCNLNDESKLLTQAINGAVEIKGSDKPEHKEEAMISFVNGDVKRLVTKPSIAGFGMNWQHCSQMAFVGLNDSNEQLYQAIRRCYRFGQKNPVNVHLISSDIEGAVLENIKRKEAQAEQMAEEMSKHVAHLTKSQVRALDREKTEYVPQSAFKIPSFMEVYS